MTRVKAELFLTPFCKWGTAFAGRKLPTEKPFKNEIKPAKQCVMLKESLFILSVGLESGVRMKK